MNVLFVANMNVFSWPVSSKVNSEPRCSYGRDGTVLAISLRWYRGWSCACCGGCVCFGVALVVASCVLRGVLCKYGGRVSEDKEKKKEITKEIYGLGFPAALQYVRGSPMQW